ncbi:SH3 domain-containing protein [uncultured Tenacibaculum sp.]|uniref:SH3 domain-containing protein n=1 Tax=uncultured Tenacibaculum sp. TaxID=174713 RepID=UPI00261DFDBB|nr:SH3 domain-containing protein [uncultured Tenacibaculum sp.]
MRNFIFTLTILFSINSFGQIINDESYLDLSFLKFKTELLNCVMQKDTLKLKDFLAERVFESKDICGYPGCPKDQLIKYYFKESAEDSWKDMLAILRFGFSRLEDENPDNIVPHDKVIFQGPSYLKKIDTENQLLILGENVNIRKEPSLKSEIIRTATYEVFNCDCNTLTMTNKTYQTVDGINWIEIKLEQNKIGYVSSKLTSYDLIKEMTIAKVNGEWKIISWFQTSGC